VLAAGAGERTELLQAGGARRTDPAPRPMAIDTVFDIASLTKVVATLPVILALVAEGALSLTTSVAELLPAFASAPGKDTVTVEQLLTHTSGLPPFRHYWRDGLAGVALRERLIAEPLQSRPGGQVAYSDMGFLVLGWLAEAVAGRGLEALFAERVTGPLGMRCTSYGPVLRADVAATERRPNGESCVGTVHDETAAALGGIAGHAGVFAPVADLVAYMAAWSEDSDRWLAADVRHAAARDRTPGLDGHRGLGWTARHDAYDQLGEAWPETAVFHSGFTGTSLALDPPSRRWVVLLTNDVHLGRGRGTINPLRRAVHTALAP
jgi:CubicO group peptidase (beta-lactamase class C family)